MTSGPSNAAFHHGYSGATVEEIVKQFQAPLDERIAELEATQENDQLAAQTAVQKLSDLLRQASSFLEQLQTLKTEMAAASRDRPVGESSRAIVLAAAAAVTATMAWFALGSAISALMAREGGIARVEPSGLAAILTASFLGVGLYQHGRFRNLGRTVAGRAGEYVILAVAITLVNSAAVVRVGGMALAVSASLLGMAVALAGFQGAVSTLRVYSEATLDSCRVLVDAVSSSGLTMAAEMERLTQASLGKTELANELARVRAQRSALRIEIAEAHILGRLVSARHKGSTERNK